MNKKQNWQILGYTLLLISMNLYLKDYIIIIFVDLYYSLITSNAHCIGSILKSTKTIKISVMDIGQVTHI